jgi:hypothetical protein
MVMVVVPFVVEVEFAVLVQPAAASRSESDAAERSAVRYMVRA